MKDFNDFLSTLTPEVYKQIAQKVNEKNIKISNNPSSQNSSVDFGNGIAAVDTIISLELLKLYHNWLNS